MSAKDEGSVAGKGDADAAGRSLRFDRTDPLLRLDIPQDDAVAVGRRSKEEPLGRQRYASDFVLVVDRGKRMQKPAGLHVPEPYPVGRPPRCRRESLTVA
ncbi:hypothetical protein MesoLjLc_29570 [Mesorhizobium sp. L-8-10]|uniref:hypothetical protein n=1 Tax=Mesorhizobium sp. L-8-10 TaxID=2744523 RepID=UPI001928EBC1|nr:hypothetical protein [Mesorhizobium sp. L-8-10]BCH31027.1 hypothetical protein MesoLjLc_29570 [Mesorhizobium sp. L-8-10]